MAAPPAALSLCTALPRDQELGATPLKKMAPMHGTERHWRKKNGTDVSKSAARVGDQQDIIAQSIRAWHRP